MSRMLEILKEIVGSGVSNDDPRISYVEVQIERKTMADAAKVVAEAEAAMSKTRPSQRTIWDTPTPLQDASE